MPMTITINAAAPAPPAPPSLRQSSEAIAARAWQKASDAPPRGAPNQTKENPKREGDEKPVRFSASRRATKPRTPGLGKEIFGRLGRAGLQPGQEF